MDRFTALVFLTGSLVLFLLEGCKHHSVEIQRLTVDQPIRVEARVDRAVAAVGDKILFTLQAVARKGSDVLLPEDVEVSPGLEIRDAQVSHPKDLGKDQVMYRKDWALSPEKVGSYIVPPMEVSYRGGADAKDFKKVKTTPVYIDVRSVLKEGDLQGDIRDIKGPVGLPTSFWFWLCALVATALLGAGIFAGYRYWERRAALVPPLLPYQWALEALDRLMDSGLLEAGKFKEFAGELSGIFRSYVERSFGIMAPERTTEEFIGEMRGRPEFNAEQQALLGKFLGFCDMIKFARYAPTHAEMSHGVGLVRNFVEETKPKPAEKAA